MISQSQPKPPYFWPLMRATPLVSLIVLITNTLYMTLPLLFGLIMRTFFDTLSGAAQTGWNIWTLVALFLATRVGVQLAEMGAAGSSAYHASLIHVLLQRNLFRTLLRVTGHALPYSSGELVNRFAEDTGAVAEPIFIATYGTGFVISTTVTLWVLLSINVQLTIIAFLPALFSVLVMNGMGKWLERFHQQAREATERVAGLLTQLLTGVQALQVAGAEATAVQRFDKLSAQRRQAVVRDVTLNTLVRSMNETTVTITTGLLLLFAAGLMHRGSFTVGDFALFMSYVSIGGGTVDEIVGWIARLLRNLKRANVSINRLFALTPTTHQRALLDTSFISLRHAPPEPPPPVMNGDTTLHELRVTDLTYRHPESGRGIENISFCVSKGAFTVITGRIGSGKSLLLETLLGLQPKQGGEIYWNGTVVANPAEFFVPPRCAYTPQAPRLFSDTLRANILMGVYGQKGEKTGFDVSGSTERAEVAAERRQAAWLDQAVYAAVLEADIAQLEHGLDTVVGPRGVKLSGGQVQRTAAARMFVQGAELLIFDDLSSALDVETEKLLWERLKQFAILDFGLPVADTAHVNTDPQSKITCLVVSHRRAALQRADHIIVLKNGKVEDAGTLDELLARCEEMQRLWQQEIHG